MLNALAMNTATPVSLGLPFVQTEASLKRPPLTVVATPALVPALVPSFDQPRRGVGTIAVVVGLHVLLLIALQTAVAKKSVPTITPEKVYLSYIAPPAPMTPSVKIVSKAIPQVDVIPQHTQLVLTTTRPPDVVGVSVAPAVGEAAVHPASQLVQSAAPLTIAAVEPVTPSMPKTITTGVEYLQKPQPVYPPMAKRAGEQGKVILRVLVNEKGLPESAYVSQSSGFNRLDEAARQAVLQARFKPYLEDGRALAVFVFVPIAFETAAS